MLLLVEWVILSSIFGLVEIDLFFNLCCLLFNVCVSNFCNEFVGIFLSIYIWVCESRVLFNLKDGFLVVVLMKIKVLFLI